MTELRSILIIGGGTAGWLTACYLARYLDIARRRDVTITLVESPAIGTIGVGEGGFPTMRTTLQFLGIDEHTFIRKTAATFKQGIRFDHWLSAPREGRTSNFFHPFEAPLYAQDESLVARWLAQDPAKRPPFAEAVTIQQRVAAGARGPKAPGDGDYDAPLSYAYHFDAERLAAVLAARGIELGVERIDDRLLAAEAGPEGIAHLRFERTGTREADLYIDCTGLHAELIGGALAEPFVSVRRYLFTDRALACRVPYDQPSAELPSHTVAAAHEAGWLWDIALRDRRGVGCVYSSDHLDDARAHAILAAHPGVGAAGADDARLICYDPGYRARHWVGNCVAVGLAAGFVEPLEATGIVMIEAAAAMIAEFWTPNGPSDASAARFNALMIARYENLLNFLKLHYCLSRRDEPFWRTNTDLQSIPPALQELLERWRWRAPSRFDFALDSETFAFFSYQYILYGMGFKTRLPGPQAAKMTDPFAKVRAYGEQALRDLPLHRDLIDRINAT
ncbi:MAG: tryptophan halogenase [Novosphingobium sp. 28-62-57]|uniref:tryptophan halogenase family protein n=1 Tax=Novosphingobium sp. 28-62-57 TaxID=1970409 RepID=UPI000BC731E5|nr:tryptophan halogenase family protein [Novosphingobium sp. 28-62-57]OYZ12610.1 MAG: tryptophan halogenase [Novosphingobium sp. 28-62-57]